MTRYLRAGWVTCLLGALFAACGGGPLDVSSGTNGAGGAGGKGPSGSGGHGGAGGPGSTGSDVGGSFTVSSGAGASGAGANGAGVGGGDTCAGETSQAQQIPLDLYLMLDSSGSMMETTGANGSGPSKWTAVTQALTTFFSDPTSAGLGVGLQHFPLLAAGVPDTCAASSDCPGQTGPCLLKLCAGLPTLVACNTASDCLPHGSGQCVALGQCGNVYCAPANGGVCSGNGQPCEPVTSSFCMNKDSCQAGDYAAPAVEIATLGGAAAALGNAIGGWSPGGATPTAPALQGALTHAGAWAGANPTHTVVVVLATDGLPTECTPGDIPGIAQLAAQGAAGAPAIKTFAIGVFSPDDIANGAPGNLDQIAAAGGTNQAFLVDTSQNVAQQFLDALDAIRGTKLACEFAVPPAGSAGALDFGKVNVEHTPPGASMPTTIGYVGQAADCDATTGGWYYDVDPSAGGTPTKIIMCPATCDAFSATVGGEIAIRVGCKTVLQPPPK